MHKRTQYLTRVIGRRYSQSYVSFDFVSGNVLPLGRWLTTWGLFFAFASEGAKRLRQFEEAPKSVQDAFWAEVKRRNAARQELELVVADLWDEPLTRMEPEPHETGVQWDETWHRRAKAVKAAQEAPEADWTPDRYADPLRDLSARVYVEVLTGIEVPHSGRMACPLPDHQGSNPQSFQVGENGWRCFACGKSGTVYDLAAILWGIQPRGQGFVEIHKRLRHIFALGAAA